MKGYKVAEIAPMGHEENRFYTIDLAKARSEMAKRLWKLRKSELVDKDRNDMNQGSKPFEFNHKNAARDGSILSITYWVWSKCSYEYDEWDTDPFELCLWEIEIVE